MTLPVFSLTVGIAAVVDILIFIENDVMGGRNRCFIAAYGDLAVVKDNLRDGIESGGISHLRLCFSHQFIGRSGNRFLNCRLGLGGLDLLRCFLGSTAGEHQGSQSNCNQFFHFVSFLFAVIRG